MNNNKLLNPLSRRQENICAYTGVFGIILSVICLVQHVMVTRDNTITGLLTLIYPVAIVSFFMLSFQKQFAPLMLIISSVLAIVLNVVWLRSGAFSLVVMMFFLYQIIVVVTIYVEQIPERLRQKRLALQAERDAWAGKI